MALAGVTIVGGLATLVDHSISAADAIGKLHRMTEARAGDVGTDVYSMWQNLFKVAKIIHEMETNGASEADAVDAAQKAVFDYSEVPQWVRVMRSAPFGAPFATFLYKALPNVLEAGFRQPTVFLPYTALIYGSMLAIAALKDVDYEDVEKLKNLVPKWVKAARAIILGARAALTSLMHDGSGGRAFGVAHSSTGTTTTTSAAITGMANPTDPPELARGDMTFPGNITT